ncbi:MAG TPA: hypothetical protein DCS48_13815 [Desulfovibrio sp.]|nr:hypothetical protein [Desulfovibrio sp.]
MLRRIGWSFFVLIFIQLFSASGMIYAGEWGLEVVTTDYPPYSYSFDGELTGYATKVVREALEQAGQAENITVVPNARVLAFAERGTNVLVYPVVITSDNKSKFHLIHKFSNRILYLYRKRDALDNSKSISEMKKNFVVGMKRDLYTREQLHRAGFKKVQEVTTDVQVLKLFKIGRVDLVAMGETVLEHAIQQYNESVPKERRFDPDDFFAFDVLQESQGDEGVYAVMSKNSNSRLVSGMKRFFADVSRQGRIVEVAHWWTNDVEKEMLQVYRSALLRAGYHWSDYMFEGGAGNRMRKVLASREDVSHRPHVMQTYMGPAVSEWAEKGVLLNLDDVAESENWHKLLPPIVDKGIRFGGHYIAAPVNIQQVNWMWLNPRILEVVGVGVPETWDALFDIAEKIKAAGFIPLSVGSEPWQVGVVFENLVLGLGGVDFHKKALQDLDLDALGGKTMLCVFECLRRVKEYSDQDPVGRSWTQSAQLVAEGKAAITFMGDWAKNVFKAAGLKPGTGFLCVPAPGTAKFFLNNTDVFAFPKGETANVAGQLQLARIVMDKSVQRRVNIAKGSLPARNDILPEGFDFCARKSMVLAKERCMLPSFNFHQTVSEEVHQLMLDVIGEFYNSDMSPQTAVKRLRSIGETSLN